LSYASCFPKTLSDFWADAVKLKERRRNNRPRPISIQKRRKDGLLAARSTWSSNQTFALHALASKLANAANGFSLFASALLRRLLVIIPHLHFAEDTFALHFLLESAKRLINVVIAD